MFADKLRLVGGGSIERAKGESSDGLSRGVETQ
jgi:hypothetical protein